METKQVLSFWVREEGLGANSKEEMIPHSPELQN